MREALRGALLSALFFALILGASPSAVAAADKPSLQSVTQNVLINTLGKDYYCDAHDAVSGVADIVGGGAAVGGTVMGNPGVAGAGTIILGLNAIAKGIAHYFC